MGRRPKQTFLQRGYKDGQEAHKKKLNITDCANQNYNEFSPHTSQNGHPQKIYKQSVLEMMWKKGNPPTLLMLMKLVQPLRKTKNRAMI